MKNRKLFLALLPATLLTLFMVLSSQHLLRHLYWFLTFDETFHRIFRQIKLAAMRSPWLLLTVLSTLTVLLMWALLSHPGVRRVLAVLLILPLLIALLLTGCWFTLVNGVMFGDVVVSLVPLLQSGAL